MRLILLLASVIASANPGPRPQAPVALHEGTHIPDVSLMGPALSRRSGPRLAHPGPVMTIGGPAALPARSVGAPISLRLKYGRGKPTGAAGQD